VTVLVTLASEAQTALTLEGSHVGAVPLMLSVKASSLMAELRLMKRPRFVPLDPACACLNAQRLTTNRRPRVSSNPPFLKRRFPAGRFWRALCGPNFIKMRRGEENAPENCTIVGSPQ
jgi:hypothetical protein